MFSFFLKNFSAMKPWSSTRESYVPSLFCKQWSRWSTMGVISSIRVDKRGAMKHTPWHARQKSLKCKMDVCAAPLTCTGSWQIFLTRPPFKYFIIRFPLTADFIFDFHQYFCNDNILIKFDWKVDGSDTHLSVNLFASQYWCIHFPPIWTGLEYLPTMYVVRGKVMFS